MTNNKIYQLLNDVKKELRSEFNRMSNIDINNHASNSTLIAENTSGSFDLADILEEQNESIMELADIISSLSEEE